MAMQKRVRRWSAAATLVCVASATSGCGFTTYTRNDDVFMSSKSVLKPTGGSISNAELSADAGQPVRVRAFQEELCTVTEQRLVDRTVITTKEPKRPVIGPWMGLIGAASLGLSAYLTVQEFRKEPGDRNYLTQAGTGLFGLLMVGGFAFQAIQSGEHREHVGPTTLSTEKAPHPCGSRTPASQVSVTLVNRGNHDEIRLLTDAQGQALVPDEELTKLNAPVGMYVGGTYFPISDATAQQVRAAATVAREKLALAEQRKAQEQLQLREQRTTALRESVKVGDVSHCGLVIEVKAPIAKIHTRYGEHWLQIAQLYAKDDAPCRFSKGVYQEP